MRVLVIGGTGFIGKPLVRALLAKGHQVTVLARENDIDRPDGVRFIQGNIMNKREIKKCFPCDVVYHLAASHDEQDRSLYKINVEGTENVVDVCKLFGVKQLVFMSTAGVLGETTAPIKEHELYKPKTRLDKSKAAAENVVKSSGLNFTIIRAPTVMGPSVAWFHVFSAIRNGHPVVGTGRNKFHTVHVDDVVKLLTVVMDNPNAAGHVFHAGTKDLMTWEEVYDTISSHMKVQREKKYHSPRKARLHSHLSWIKHAARTAQPPRIHMTKHHIEMMSKSHALSIQKARDVLGFEPFYTTPQAISETFRDL